MYNKYIPARPVLDDRPFHVNDLLDYTKNLEVQNDEFSFKLDEMQIL